MRLRSPQTVPACRTLCVDGLRAQELLPTPLTLRERRPNVLAIDENSGRFRWKIKEKQEKPMKSIEKSRKINEIHWKSRKINEIHWKINGFHWYFLEFSSIANTFGLRSLSVRGVRGSSWALNPSTHNVRHAGAVYWMIWWRCVPIGVLWVYIWPTSHDI